jgi:hypothetical protein
VKAFVAAVAVLLLAGVMGCTVPHDPAKWYLTTYDNGKFVFQHDHKDYTAECFQSFGVGNTKPDSTADCT